MIRTRPIRARRKRRGCTGSSTTSPRAPSALPEAATPADLPPGTLEGINDWKRTGYNGPCPPIGRHRYFHKLYALDVVLADLASRPRRSGAAMRGHVLGETELIGTYEKGK